MTLKGVLCEVCGEPATRYIGDAVLPVCSNVVCHVIKTDEVKTLLAEQSDDG